MTPVAGVRSQPGGQRSADEPFLGPLPAARRPPLAIIIGLVLLGHGAIHLLGAAKGLGLADVDQLTEPISAAGGVLWLVASALVMLTAVLVLIGDRRAWLTGSAGLAASQTAIVGSWHDAWAGTLLSVVLLIAVVYGFRSAGPRSLRARFGRDTAAALGRAEPGRVVTELDLTPFPAPVARYLRASGAVGRPRTASIRARWHGRIRADVTKPWMAFHAEQTNVFGPHPQRFFLLCASHAGMSFDALHAYEHAAATMQVRVGGALTVADVHGPDLSRAETVTILNDLCVLAPGALVGAPILWTSIDDMHAGARFTNGPHTVDAVLTFDRAGQLVDFRSDDRLRASVDGRHFTRQPWTTPLGAYREFGGRFVGSRGLARWSAPPPEGVFAYGDFELDAIEYDPSSH